MPVPASRLTADGQIGNCLLARDESDLRTHGTADLAFGRPIEDG
jgi:molybdenum cofactor biosynthesis enzyme MoaA